MKVFLDLSILGFKTLEAHGDHQRNKKDGHDGNDDHYLDESEALEKFFSNNNKPLLPGHGYIMIDLLG